MSRLKIFVLSSPSERRGSDPITSQPAVTRPVVSRRLHVVVTSWVDDAVQLLVDHDMGLGPVLFELPPKVPAGDLL